MLNFNYRKVIYLIACLLIVNLLLLFYIGGDGKRIVINLDNPEIIFLDVGQGDAILIRTTRGENILIDGGPDKNIIYKLDQYIPVYRRVIDLMILTHPDPDHLNGLIEVMKRYEVKNFIYNGVKDESVEYNQFLEQIEFKKVNKKIIWRGNRINFSDGYFDFIYPLNSLEGKNLKDDNEGSLVFKAVINEKQILFTGDASQKVEKELIDQKIDLSADILKVAHHGSKTSSGLEFLSLVKPKYAVISVGKNNKFGHPNLRVLRNLEKMKTNILQTNQLGDIIFKISNKELILKTTNK